MRGFFYPITVQNQYRLFCLTFTVRRSLRKRTIGASDTTACDVRGPQQYDGRDTQTRGTDVGQVRIDGAGDSGATVS